MNDINRREFFDELGHAMRYQSLESFYDITLESTKAFGGDALLQHAYNNSLFRALQDVYPSFAWNSEKFSQNISFELQQNRNQNVYNLSTKPDFTLANDLDIDTHVSSRVYWSTKANQKKFLDWLGNELKLSNMEDWYSVTD